MIYKPQKLQLSLTIQFAVFFILITVFVYGYFSQKFEEEVLDKFTFKSEIFAKYLEQEAYLFDTDTDIKDKTQLIQLMMYNDVVYLVIEDEHGSLLDAVNLEEAEKYLYVAANNNDNISFDETVYRVVLPVNAQQKSYWQSVSRTKAGLVATDLKKKTYLTALFSLLILLGGMVFTYFLSSISFRPITKLLNALSKSDIKEQKFY